MEKFTASNGATVETIPTGHLILPPAELGLGEMTQQALREFFLHERDQELGRWRWPENQQYVVYPLEDTDDVWVLNESLARGEAVDRCVAEATTDLGTLARLAARAYFAAHPVPKPWHDAKPGEVWAVTWDGHETPCHVVENAISSNGLVFNDGTRETPGVLAPCITHARRIWPE